MWSKLSFRRWVKRCRSAATEPAPGRTVRRFALRVEGLEDRALPAALAAIDPQVILAAQHDLAGTFSRAGYDLALLYREFQSFAATSSISSPTYPPIDPLLQVANGSVVVDVLPTSDLGTTRADLEALGFRTIAFAPFVLSGTLPIASLESAAGLSSVRAIQPAYKPITSVGSVTSQGLKAQQSDKLTDFLGLDGTGYTIGVLSDSYNALGGASADVSSGDLPGTSNPFKHLTPVNVLDDSLGGTDEGRAMLQIVHDVAPGAKLAFATAGATQTQFRNNIVALANAGANAIVDDFTFLTEPMFQDGIVARAVDNLVAVGVPYFSAAGNLGRASYEQAYRNSGTNLGSAGTNKIPMVANFFAHDFDPGTGVDLYQTVTVPPGTTSFSFQWSDPFFSVNGGSGAATNMDIAAFDMAGNFLNIGGFNANVGADPVEVFSISNPSGGPIQVQLAIGKVSGPDPTLMKYVAFRPSAGGDVSIDEHATNSSTIFGHANAKGAETIGAALYSQTPPYGVSPPQLEPFSSRGGTPILYGFTGNLLATPQTRQSPDLVAPDGVSTTFFGPSFVGTSAAAPHAAGVAVLLLQAKPNLTVAQLYSSLESTAIDIGPAGYDADSGWGLIDATAALIGLNAGPYTVTFGGTGGNDSLLVRRDTSGNKFEFVLGGTVQFTIPASQVASIAVNGFGGNDALTIDSTNGAIDRSIAFDGGPGTDSLSVVGTAELPAELSVYSNAAPVPTITVASGAVPLLSFTSVEAATLAPTNGIVNLIGDNNSPTGQADDFAVRGTGPGEFTASLNGSPPIQFTGASALNAFGRALADSFTVSPWASNSPAGWGVQTYFDGGITNEGDLLTYDTVAANPVSEDIAIQPANAGSGEIRVTNASDGSAIGVISYAHADLAVNDTDGFATDTDSLTLRGTNAVEDFVVDLTAPGTSAAPMIDVRQLGGGSLYRLRSFLGFPQIGLVGLGGSDTIDLLAGRDDGAVSLSVDLGLPTGGPTPSDRDRIQVYGTIGGSDLFRYTAGATTNSGRIEVARSSASAPTAIDFVGVEVVGFNGGPQNSVGGTGADRVELEGTSGNDTFTLSTILALTASGQIDAGPLLDFVNLGSTGSTFALDGLAGNDNFTIVQAVAWGLAGVSINGGAKGTGFDSANIVGSSGDDRYTYTPSSTVLGVEAPVGGPSIPYYFANIDQILIDALGHDLGDRLVITEPIGYTPIGTSGTLPADPPLSYRNVEFFTLAQPPAPKDK